MKDSYKLRDICKLIGLKPKQVQIASETGIVSILNTKTLLRGGERYYDEKSLIDFAIIFELLKFKLKYDFIREIIHGLEKLKKETEIEVVYIVKKEASVYVTSFLDEIQEDIVIFVLNYQEIKKRLAKLLQNFKNL